MLGRKSAMVRFVLDEVPDEQRLENIGNDYDGTGRLPKGDILSCKGFRTRESPCICHPPHPGGL